MGSGEMSDEQPEAAGRRRTRGAAATARSEALERLKALRRGGRREMDAGGFQIKMEEPIYDTVDDDQYEALVAKRREEVKGFIVDDDGLGYGDEGQEEDWSLAGVALSSGESDEETERSKRRKNNSNSETKEKKVVKKPSALASAAALMGKQRISNMFTSSVFKKDIQKNLSCDSIVDDVIAEFAPDESDRERRRRATLSNLGLSNANNKVPNSSGVLAVKIENPAASVITLDVSNEIAKIGDRHCDIKSAIGNECSQEAENVNSEQNGLPVTERGDNSSKVLQSEETKGTNEALEHENNEDLHQEAESKEVEKKVFSLNAKIEEPRDSALSATAGWQAVRIAGQNVAADSSIPGPGVNPGKSSEEKMDFEVESDGSLSFYILDAHEEIYGANAGNIYLFGKVKSGGTYHSCCVVVKNMQRCVYAIPTVSFMHSRKIMELDRSVEEVKMSLVAHKGTTAKHGRDSEKSRISAKDLKDSNLKLEKDFKESQTALYTHLHELASNLKTEITKELLDRNVSNFSMTPVKRNYAFERSDIPHGENYVLKISYPFKDPPLPSDLKGNHFCALLGTHNSALEHFLIKRKIKGPSWLSISKFTSGSASQHVSWCKFEITVDFPKDIQVSTLSKKISEIPPVIVTAINFKTIINEKQNVNEIVSASVICCHRAKIDTPMLASEWTRPGMLTHFTVLRKLEGGIFPMGFTKEAADKNSKAGSNVICYESSERALLNRLMIELHKLDSDVLVGHNISGFDLDVLLHRVQACRVPSSMWSKIGRLKRSTMPKLNKGSSVFGSGASSGIMSCIAGRLLCDTYICSRDLLKEVSYSLTQLAKTQLNKDRKEVTPHDIPQMFQHSESLMLLVEYGETDAWLSMELMFHLSILPLTRQLTNISGNLWHKTLQGARAQRVEYLLLHAFHAKKFIVPDKFFAQSKEARTIKRKVDSGVESKDIAPDDANFDDGPLENYQGKSKKGPSYSGGLVLEPKKGLYDKYVLLLDFNSLYPSIIQEFNICFTTVERSSEESIPRLPSSKRTGVLPELLKNLVERRRMVKSWLKTASGLKVQQLDIQQQALKLTANSMYGCLGFSNSRFYAKPLAELITLQGREILQSTVALVQNNLNLEVIYGDTDSIMIYSGLDDIGKAKSIAGKVIQEVNKKYRCLEIDLDGLYKRMLLLKKKKYAAVKMQFKDGTSYEVIERKGLDMVRRDWSLLSKERGDYCLSQILSGGSCEDVVEAIHSSLVKVQEEMRNGEIPLEKYVITKTLTKPPEAYPDARSQPHVEVALRMKRNGYVTGFSAGDAVPYIICCEQGQGSVTSVGIAQRARHPEELKTGNENWIIDIDYYLAQQIHPVISRLCASIQGTSPARLADCLGLDSSKFQNKSSDSVANDPSCLLSFALDDEERYRGCEPLVLSCPSCSETFHCSPVLSSICAMLNTKSVDTQTGSTVDFWQRLSCPKCVDEGEKRISPAIIANQVKRQAEGFVSTYYKGHMMCDDETCNYTTRSVNLRIVGDSERGTTCPNYPRCNGHLIRKYTEADLYRQLSYFCYILDTVRCIDKIEGDKRLLVEKELVRIRPLVETALSTVQKIRDRCAYGWIQLKGLTLDV
ncbi:DNA polymerase alpha catalytic subunit [Andrographis paniculata]|uniref:DNA polymerase alpha catalytic subunit n=1 Tax=Andrographis paniculata TaxID=175694 RepID=UPI0021E94D88|nr:DNA polymerase alpha catalytic subunit [Andrographis paniculata]